MGDDLASVIAATQEQLGGLFQKPRLSEKLLSKAPFRFLHDVISAVTASTGFAAGLYSGEELDSGSVKDKGSKIAYLDKIIALVGICSGHDIDVRPSKVVAGLEPEGTNALLRALGKCAKSPDLDFDEAVRRALAGEPPGRNPPPLRADGGAPGPTGGGSAAAGRGGSGGEESKAEAKGGGEGGGGMRGSSDGGGGSAGSDGRRGSGGGDAENKASAKQEIEQIGQAAKAMGVPQSRRLSSRAGGGGRAEAKSRSNSLGTGGLGDDPTAAGGRDLTAEIEACTGEIAVTRQMLEPIISRPRLSDKLLNMPPFRFLHDIVSEVTRQTGFGQGLYTGDEMDSSLVKAKPAKMAYLDKLIMLVGNSLNTLVDARPAKIVAGLEAGNTNRMLQLLALAAVEKPDSSRAVELVLDTTPVKRRSSSTSGGVSAATAAATASAAATGREHERPPQEQQQPHRSSSATSDANTAAAAAAAAAAEAEAAAAAAAPAAERDGSRGSSAGEAKSGEGGRGGQQEAAEEKGGGDEDMAGAGAAADAPRSMRPRTARRRPPTLKDNTKQFVDHGRAQVPDEAMAAPKKASINIIMDGDSDQESDDEDVGDAVRTAGAGVGERPGGGAAGAKGDGVGHTAMVADILKEKEKAEMRAKEADAESKGRGDGQEAKGSAEGGGGGIRMGRLGGVGRRNSASLSSTAAPAAAAAGGGSKLAGGGGGGSGYGDADVAKLKDAIQTLCQSTHPLGKCMDFVHEDLSLMSQEMDRWRALYKVKADALESERAATEAFLQPLQSQLRDLEDQLKESSMKIDGVKAGISVNDKKINSLLKMMVTS